MILVVGIFNRQHVKLAQLYVEEVQPELVTRLGLKFIPDSAPARPESTLS
jgi:hypothetical protein